VSDSPKPNQYTEKQNMKNLNFSLTLLVGFLGSIESGQCFYNPHPGRWLSRDPIEENGGKNVLAFLGNTGANSFDIDGRITVTLKSKTVETCGGFRVEFEFQMDTRNPEGYIVQEVTNEQDANKCSGARLTLVDDHWWEAWPVSAAPAGQSAFIKDTVNRPSIPDSRGNGKQVGKIRFFPKTITRELNTESGGWSPGGVASAGTLLSTKIQPTWWNSPDQSEPEGTREVSYNYLCCCPFLIHNTVVTVPAQ
jgi:RHS repeat-associated protein